MLNIRIPVPRFVSPGEIYLGKGSLGTLRALNRCRIAIIASRSAWKNEQIQAGVIQALGHNSEFSVIHPEAGEPSIRSVENVASFLSASRPEWIIALGGGSTIDSAKLAWIFYEHPDLNLETALRMGGIPTLRGKARFCVVPTVSGSGSEVSSAAIIKDDSDQKRAFVSPDLLPDLVILDPTLSISLPKTVYVPAAMDALCHAIEGYVSRYSNRFLDAQAETAGRLVISALERLLTMPEDLSAHEDLMHASVMAGWVQNYKVPGLGHALAHQLARFGVSHGSACAAFLVPALRYNARLDTTVETRLITLGCLLFNRALQDIEEFFNCLTEMQAAHSLKVSVRALAGTEVVDQGEQICAGTLADPCARANPVALDAQAVRQVLESAL